MEKQSKEPSKPARKCFTMFLDADLLAKFAKKAQENDLSMSQVARALVKEWVEAKQQKLFY